MKNKNTYIVANFGEIFLKGGNIRFFEEKLLSNFLGQIGKLKEKIIFEKKSGGVFFMKLDLEISEDDIIKIEKVVENTPGFATYYRAYFCKTNLEEIAKLAGEVAMDWTVKKYPHIFQEARLDAINPTQPLNKPGFRTFGIATDKTDKGVKIKTRDINIAAGSAVFESFKKIGNELSVNLDNPDLQINIKIKQERSFIFINKKKAIGGLPVGTAGEAIAMFSGGIDSPVAAFLAMKRGLNITAVHFHSVPQTSPKSIEKVKDLLRELTKFQKNIKLYLIPIINVQKDIVKNADRKLSIVLQRRAFLKMGQMVANIEQEKYKKNIQAFVTGDSLGQVASQTMENMITVSEVLDGKGKVVFRPLLTYDKIEIMDLARKIETLEISERAHEDVCSLFVPKKPETKSKIEYTKKEESSLTNGVLEKAILEAEILEI